ncbi:MAG: nucleotidyltransferase substrate binding protein [Gammaproteobacteria bacterium]|nr:nucleotidyltransferase substrate binding protein [Gammaproteobacteria bacterium]
MTDYDALIETQQRKLKKAITHLEYSYKKVLKLSSNPAELDEESLEVWESFAARFSRVADIFLAQYLRAIVLKNDPGFSGSMRDFLNQGEKLGVINDAEIWLKIREIRNVTVHDYSESDLKFYFERLKKECPLLLSICFN